jgi:hypothetical protein
VAARGELVVLQHITSHIHGSIFATAALEGDDSMLIAKELSHAMQSPTVDGKKEFSATTSAGRFPAE